MLDLLIVSLREDRDLAGALKQAFAQCGLQAMEAGGSADELHEAAAILFVMSDKAAQSPSVLEAAVRAAAINKAVIARFTQRPLPLSLRAAPGFDLTQWSGDPDEPAFDGVFAAADRLAARARDGRRAGLKPANEFGRDAPRAADALAIEAGAWAAIKDSDDPAKFEAFLSRFGADSAFAELAHLRLTQAKAVSARAAPRAPHGPAAADRAWTGWSVSPYERAPRPPSRPVSAEPPRPRVVVDNAESSRRTETSSGGAGLWQGGAAPEPARKKREMAPERQIKRSGGWRRGALALLMLGFLAGGVMFAFKALQEDSGAPLLERVNLLPQDARPQAEAAPTDTISFKEASILPEAPALKPTTAAAPAKAKSAAKRKAKTPVRRQAKAASPVAEQAPGFDPNAAFVPPPYTPPPLSADAAAPEPTPPHSAAKPQAETGPLVLQPTAFEPEGAAGPEANHLAVGT